MDLDLIEKLFKLLDKSMAEELEVTENGVTIRMSKRAGALPQRTEPGRSAPPVAAEPAFPSAAALASADRTDIRAGITGTFYRASGPDVPPFVEVGQRVADGDRLALIEAMKTFNPVEAECDGVIVEIAAQDATLVETGTLLFRIEKA